MGKSLVIQGIAVVMGLALSAILAALETLFGLQPQYIIMGGKAIGVLYILFVLYVGPYYACYRLRSQVPNETSRESAS